MFAVSRVRCRSRAIWIQIFSGSSVAASVCEAWEQLGCEPVAHRATATEECKSLLLRRHRLLPIEHQLPSAGGIRLPDLEKIAGLGRLRSRVGIFPVVVGKVSAAAHVVFHYLHRQPGLLRAEQFYRGLFSDGRKRAVAIKSNFIAAKLPECFGEIESRRDDERILSLLQRFQRPLAAILRYHELQGRFYVRLGILNAAIKRNLPGAVLFFLPEGT